MDTRDLLTEDGRAVLMLCSTLGLGDEPAASEGGPYTLSAWNELARKIRASSLERPGALLGRSAAELAEALGVAPQEAECINRLLDRGGRVALELEGLFSRGMWVITRADPDYPEKLRQTLKHQAPTVLCGAGDIRLLKRTGIAVVGSRQIDEAGRSFACCVGRKCAEAGVPVVSGGARGTDSLAMEAAIEAGGIVFGVIADSLERTIRQPDLRQLLLDSRLILLTPYAPTAGFSVGAAMGRNKIIYGLADYGIVVSSDLQKGGTWAGAVEVLRAGWCPLFVRSGDGVPEGSRELIRKGAVALEETQLPAIHNLPEWLCDHAATKPVELELFAGQVQEPRTRYRASPKKSSQA